MEVHDIGIEEYCGGHLKAVTFKPIFRIFVSAFSAILLRGISRVGFESLIRKSDRPALL